jgi:hypothetical protein
MPILSQIIATVMSAWICFPNRHHIIASMKLLIDLSRKLVTHILVMYDTKGLLRNCTQIFVIK